MKLLIKNGRLIDPRNGIDAFTDILISDGKIAEIKAGIPEGKEEMIDAKGMYVFPGFVDAHCHLRDPGFEYKEDIETGTKSAVMGGFTSVACMPNTKPVTDSAAVINYILTKAASDGACKVYPIGAVSKGQEGEELAEIGEMKFAGAVAISDDGKPVASASLMKKALQYAASFEIPLISHCEDRDLADGGVMNEGYMSTVLGLKGVPSAAEDTMVAREIILAEYLGVPVHIAHVSTAASVELIRQAKKRGVKVTCETCPHYFSLTEAACEDFNTNAKVNPPLRSEKDRLAVIEGLKDDTIDMIVTDHAPHHIDEKNVEFNVAASGIVGFETAFAAGVTFLVKTGALTLDRLINKMSHAPSELLGLNAGSLEPGKPADLVIADTDTLYKVKAADFKSKSRNTPFDGMLLAGRILYTIVDGVIAVEDGILVKE